MTINDFLKSFDYMATFYIIIFHNLQNILSFYTVSVPCAIILYEVFMNIYCSTTIGNYTIKLIAQIN